MTLTKDIIDKLRFAGRMEIDAELEAGLLQQFGEEPYPEAYSEQDLQEQVRKYVRCYTRDKETVSMDL
jgi:hypothetical protein